SKRLTLSPCHPQSRRRPLAPGYNAPHELGLPGTAGTLRTGERDACPVARHRPDVLQLAGTHPLRELLRRHPPPAATLASAFPHHLRLVPLGRRPGRRGRRRATRPAPARLVAR